jgi:hypothetical protein
MEQLPNRKNTFKRLTVAAGRRGVGGERALLPRPLGESP